jgi:hypothetical protein
MLFFAYREGLGTGYETMIIISFNENRSYEIINFVLILI